jgi:hypothetical protein
MKRPLSRGFYCVGFRHEHEHITMLAGDRMRDLQATRECDDESSGSRVSPRP